MHTPLGKSCQSGRRLAGALALLGSLLAGAVSAAPIPPPAPAPPVWMRELQALQTRTANPPAALAPAYRQLAARYPDQAVIQRACGDFLAETADRPDEAFAFWQRAQALAPADPDTADALANGHLRRGEWRAAVAQFRRAVAARPEEPRFHFALGNVLCLFRRDLTDAARPDPEDVLRAALDEFRQAARLAPASVEYAQAYAETFYTLARPDWDAALAAWRAVLELSAATNPDFARSHLVRVSLRQGQPAAARAYLAEMNSSAFVPIKTKLLRQIETLERGPR